VSQVAAHVPLQGAAKAVAQEEDEGAQEDAEQPELQQELPELQQELPAGGDGHAAGAGGGGMSMSKARKVCSIPEEADESQNARYSALLVQTYWLYWYTRRGKSA
jgi:hypothetical protein